jgi:hypothetical protein
MSEQREGPNHALSKGSSGRSVMCVAWWCKQREHVRWKRRMRCWPVEWEAGGLTCESGCARFGAVVFTLKLHPVFVALQALREALQVSLQGETPPCDVTDRDLSIKILSIKICYTLV